jgi:hypothetical protein
VSRLINLFLFLIFQRCSFIYGHDGKLEKFTRDMQERMLHQVIEPMACDGLRTISVAFRDFVPGKAEINQVHCDGEPNWEDEDNIVNNLTCLCVVGIEDPVRPEVRRARRDGAVENYNGFFVANFRYPMRSANVKRLASPCAW